MVFLNPSVLFGLAAAAVPIIIHFFNLRKLKKIEFSSIRFLKELQRSKIRKLKIKQWILLFLRVLLILMLVAAFSRPTIESVSGIGVGSTAKTTAVFIIDNSASMSIVNQNGSLFNQAKNLIKELTEEFQSSDEVKLLFTTEPTKGYVLESKTKLSDFLDRILISQRKNRINETLIEASKAIKNSNNLNKEIYILSDFQKNNFININEIKKENLFDDNTRIYGINFSEKDVSNLGISAVKINNQIFQPGKSINISAIVNNFSAKQNKSGVLSLFINDSRVAQKQVSLEPNSSSSEQFNITLKDYGLLKIYAELEDDNFLFDNKYYQSVLVNEKIKVLILRDNQLKQDFLKFALESNLSFDVKYKKSDRINSYNLNDFDVVIVEGGTKINDFEKITQYLEEGNNLIYFPSAQIDLNNLNRILRNLKLPSANGIIPYEKNTQLNFDKIDFSHPLFNEVFSSKKKNLEAPLIKKGINFSTTRGLINILKLNTGSPFLAEKYFKNGKILFFNTTTNLAWSNFAIKNIFAPLMFKSIYYLGGAKVSTNSAFVGENISFDIGKRPFNNLKLIRPDLSEEIVTGQIKNGIIKVKNTSEAGIYKLETTDRVLRYSNVNITRDESEMNFYTADELDNYFKQSGILGKKFILNKNDNIKASITKSRYGSELWKIFLVIAFIIALIEMIIARNSKKEIAEIE